MRVLLAGATGAIGKPLLTALAGAGHEVTAIIRNQANRDVVRQRGAVPVVADVMDREGLLRAVDGMRLDVVMHQATAMRDAGLRIREDDPTKALRGPGTEHLLAAARLVGARRFVTQSLITGYGYHDFSDRVLTEDDEFGRMFGNAGDPVVETSVATERQTFNAEGIEGIALRYGLFYGPEAFSDMFADLLRKRVPLLPRGKTGGTCLIHVQDAAEAAVAAMEHGEPGNAYNIVDDAPIGWRDFIGTVAEAHGTPRPISLPAWVFRRLVPYLGCQMIDTTLRVSHEKATRELGWTPRIPDLRSGLGLA
ncbi:NAD(P)-dependent oxidoreductase [Saccharopolyspora indica]|uniref:NAD-dependent epimerase/dehydratase family protein n=1 Tax=Saccharopolyspora indica TaxID=1229659 RepID=UPI0022EAEC4E|nr:NAD(P)-dependent oxidoreductase [Saccharopolyspora indica]MDA3642448.1 NAD(P)-dependent oxidoreductase [Saccharopolyspora indica]